MADPLQDFAGLLSAVADAWRARFGDAGKDLTAVEDLERVLADVGVPHAGLALALTQAIGVFVEARAALAPVNDGGQYWFYRAGPTVGR